MEQDPRHTDNVARGDVPERADVAETSRAAARAIDNAERAAAAERERTFTEGGDDGTAPPRIPTTTPAPPALVAAATARIRGLERPSPFGVAQFPPLPLPPGMPRS